MESSKSYLAQECCLLYYEKHMQQNEIASLLGISRAYVSRLLTYALEENLVEIKVVLPSIGARDARNEVDMLNRFKKLKKAFILKSLGESYTSANIGTFTAENIDSYIREARSIGLSLGQSVEKTISALNGEPNTQFTKKKLVQLMGNLTLHTNQWAQPHEIISSLSKKCSAEVYFLNAPIYVYSQELCEKLYEEESIRAVCLQWRNLDLALMGIESAQQDSKLFPLMHDAGRSEIIEGGAIGNIAANYFDENGRQVPVMTHNRIGISFEELSNIKNKIVIGYGESKVLPLKAALNGGLIDALVTDSITSEMILSLD